MCLHIALCQHAALRDCVLTRLLLLRTSQRAVWIVLLQMRS